MSFLCCPICDAMLKKDGRRWLCPAGHSYDIAKEGHTHLLPANRKHSAAPGDDKGMAAARAAFLSKGYYAPLKDALCELCCRFTGKQPAVLDSGCGEGYYTSAVYQALTDAGKQVDMAGIDISKDILRLAARREKRVDFAVASSYRLPAADRSVDLLLNCFSPLAIEEFYRVLKPGGVFLYVVPSAEHLWGLKQVLYEQPYPNEVRQTPYEGFQYELIHPVRDTITLTCPEDIQSLFQMTPYYWKTPKAGRERLAQLTTLTTDIAFDIHVFRRDV
ncbi:MAG: methyltransferase domain-containing protein [Ruminococcaceae bacterium]|nr:methyltransferase domain-containing protein [Oscillospiraceae bacterium]